MWGAPMEHIPSFTRSHWMLPLGKSLGCIALAAAMVDDFDCKHKNTNKTKFLASVQYTFFASKPSNFWDPKLTLYSHHQCHKLIKTVRHHNSRGRACTHYKLSNVVRGQKFVDLLICNRAKKKMVHIHASSS
jgi:hypothetical protein